MNANLKVKLSQLSSLYEARKGAIQSRLNDFAQVSSKEYFYELLYCLLTPQSSAANAEATIEALQKAGFSENGLNPEHILRTKEHYIRFHKTKSKHLMWARENFPSIQQAISNGLSAFELREWLVSHVKGLGHKEATHFLRNIGKNGGLAILDRHILRNLKRFGVVRVLPKSLSRKQYYVIEKKFSAFARRISIPVDHLDLLFWSMETGEIRK